MSAAHDIAIAHIRERHEAGDPPRYSDIGTLLAVIDELQAEVAAAMGEAHERQAA